MVVVLKRADGNWAGDLDLTRRSIAMALAGGYAVAAFSADAEPIHTDEQGLVTATVDIQAADRKIPAYLARPAAKGKHPVVFVNSEIFGVHEWVKDVCRRLAKAGYVALAPDLFVRAGDPSKIANIQEVMKIVQATPGDQVTSDTTASLKWLAAQPFADTKKMAVTGFCWGGGATWLCAERFPEFKAACPWYGPVKAGPYPRTPPIELVKDLHCPVLGFYGAKDRGIPQKDVDDILAACKAAGKPAEIIVYPNSEHGFLADYRPSYNATDGADAWAKMLAFFKKNGVA
jgi:carboxymethylenebutenolidase